MVSAEARHINLLRDALGKPGAGVCPVRGHSNVQGDRTMGVWERPRDEFLDQMERCLGFAPPRHHVFDAVESIFPKTHFVTSRDRTKQAVESIKAMHAGKAKIFVGLCGNFLWAAPKEGADPSRARAHRNRSAQDGAAVSDDRELDGVVEMSRGRLEPVSPHLTSEPAILCHIAARTLGARSKIEWLPLADDYDRIRDLIAAMIPGCEDYNSTRPSTRGTTCIAVCTTSGACSS